MSQALFSVPGRILVGPLLIKCFLSENKEGM